MAFATDQSSEHEWINLYITPNITYLTKALRIDLKFLHCLMEESLLDFGEVDKLKVDTLAHEQKVHSLFSLHLRGKGQDTFGRFCNALRKASYPFVVDHLHRFARRTTSGDSSTGTPTMSFERPLTVNEPELYLNSLPNLPTPADHGRNVASSRSYSRTAPHVVPSLSSSQRQRSYHTAPNPGFEEKTVRFTVGDSSPDCTPYFGGYRNSFQPQAHESGERLNRTIAAGGSQVITDAAEKVQTKREDQQLCSQCKSMNKVMREAEEKVKKLKEEKRSLTSLFCKQYTDLETDSTDALAKEQKARKESEEALEEAKNENSRLKNELVKMENMVSDLYRDNRTMSNELNYLKQFQYKTELDGHGGAFTTRESQGFGQCHPLPPEPDLPDEAFSREQDDQQKIDSKIDSNRATHRERSESGPWATF
ncbi:uncharacterized protein [Oscarella lobularis]|uniref:uncharacterized protein isoform X2 n=1 Tax=Oscarella lobularis TaxID=121494 RepID=UPI0033136888